MIFVSIIALALSLDHLLGGGDPIYATVFSSDHSWGLGWSFLTIFFVAKCEVRICEENGLLLLGGGVVFFFQNWMRALNFGSNSQWLHHRCWTSIAEKDPQLRKNDTALKNHPNWGYILILIYIYDNIWTPIFTMSIYVACAFCKKIWLRSYKYDHGSCSKKRLARTGGHHPVSSLSIIPTERRVQECTSKWLTHLPLMDLRCPWSIWRRCGASGGLQSKIWRQF